MSASDITPQELAGFDQDEAAGIRMLDGMVDAYEINLALHGRVLAVAGTYQETLTTLKSSEGRMQWAALVMAVAVARIAVTRSAGEE